MAPETRDCFNCTHHAHDMDDAFCAHPESFKASPTFGLSLGAMRRDEKLCGSNAKLFFHKNEIPFE